MFDALVATEQNWFPNNRAKASIFLGEGVQTGRWKWNKERCG